MVASDPPNCSQYAFASAHVFCSATPITNGRGGWGGGDGGGGVGGGGLGGGVDGGCEGGVGGEGGLGGAGGEITSQTNTSEETQYV